MKLLSYFTIYLHNICSKHSCKNHIIYKFAVSIKIHHTVQRPIVARSITSTAML